jgi:COP9 signalosome complex subunit 4
METKLAEIVKTTSQKDKASGYISLVAEIFARSASNPTEAIADLNTLVGVLVNQDHAGVVVARQVLGEVVKDLQGGKIADQGLRKQAIEQTLETIQPRLVSYEEQATALRLQLADLLEEEEDWSGAAKVLMGISMDSGNRVVTDEEKLNVYIRIVRLLLEDEDSTLAETYYNRAALLITPKSDRTTQLAFKLSQARISDYGRKFVEAATRYHELSWVEEIDPEERLQAASAAVTCAVLAPAGPNRSRVLASLCRDERTAQLPNYTILRKMYLEHIIRPAEVKEFEATLKPHQLARIAQSSSDKIASKATDDDTQMADVGASTRTGPATVLDRAVMEHNLLSCTKIYNNITFSGLGALLDLTPGAAETMARRMIEQGRLKGSIDQVEKLIWFESRHEDDEGQGKAGGLGDVNQEREDTGAPFTKKWDRQIRQTASSVEEIVQHLTEKGLIPDIAATA